jgi:hypothetical protein
MGLAAIRNYRAAAMTFAGSAIAFSTMLLAIGAQRADEHQTSHVILRAAFEAANDPQLASYKILEPSWVFYAGRPIEELPHGNSAEKDATGPQQVVDHLFLHSEGFVIIRTNGFYSWAASNRPRAGQRAIQRRRISSTSVDIRF